MRKVTIITMLLLIVLSLAPPLIQEAQARAVICSWIRGTGCNWRGQCDDWCGVDVFSTGGGWEMVITCASGDGGRWSGNGEWGGNCR